MGQRRLWREAIGRARTDQGSDGFLITVFPSCAVDAGTDTRRRRRRAIVPCSRQRAAGDPAARSVLRRHIRMESLHDPPARMGNLSPARRRTADRGRTAPAMLSAPPRSTRPLNSLIASGCSRTTPASDDQHRGPKHRSGRPPIAAICADPSLQAAWRSGRAVIRVTKRCHGADQTAVIDVGRRSNDSRRQVPPAAHRPPSASMPSPLVSLVCADLDTPVRALSRRDQPLSFS